VFIQNGQLHIIPKPSTPGQLTQLPVAMVTISEAISLVADPTVPTVASDAIQSSIESRLSQWDNNTAVQYSI